jgi:hypothetical protein
MLDSAARGAFMTKTVSEAKAILEKNMLRNIIQWYTKRVPTSSRKVNSAEKVDFLTAKIDAIYAYISK